MSEEELRKNDGDGKNKRKVGEVESGIFYYPILRFPPAISELCRARNLLVCQRNKTHRYRSNTFRIALPCVCKK